MTEPTPPPTYAELARHAVRLALQPERPNAYASAAQQRGRTVRQQPRVKRG